MTAKSRFRTRRVAGWRDPVSQVAAGHSPGVGQRPAQPLDGRRARAGPAGAASSARSCRHLLGSLLGCLGGAPGEVEERTRPRSVAAEACPPRRCRRRPGPAPRRVSAAARSRTGTLTRRSVGVDLSLGPGRPATVAAVAASWSARRTDVEPVAAERRLAQRIRRPGGDHPAVVDPPRPGRPAGRPRPGTGWSAARWSRRRPAPGRPPQTSLRPRGSSPVVGSSRNSTGGAGIQAGRQVEPRRIRPSTA